MDLACTETKLTRHRAVDCGTASAIFRNVLHDGGFLVDKSLAVGHRLDQLVHRLHGERALVVPQATATDFRDLVIVPLVRPSRPSLLVKRLDIDGPFRIKPVEQTINY